jgi:hypothetical protein
MFPCVLPLPVSFFSSVKISLLHIEIVTLCISISMHERINHTDGPPSRKSIKTTEEEKTAVAELFSIMDHFVDVFLLIDHVQNVIEPDSFHRAKRENHFSPSLVILD